MYGRVCVGVVLLVLAGTGLRASPVHIDSLIHAISERQQELYLRIDDWRAKVESRTSWLSIKGEPRKTRIVEKEFRIQNLEQTEEILHAEEWNDSSSTDVTEEAIRARHRFNFRRKFEELLLEELSAHGDSLPADEMFPFSEEHRPLYRYAVSGDTMLFGRPVRIVEFRRKTPDSDYFNGRVYADRQGHEIYKAVFWPSDNPLFVQHLRVEFSFFVHPDGFYGPRHLDITLEAELMFINLLRRRWVERYTDYSLLEPGGTGR